MSDGDNLRKAIELANRLVLKHPNLDILNNNLRDQYPIITQSLEYLLKERNAQRKLFLPNLSAFNNNALCVFSDYSGEGSGSYYTYSVLVCGFGFTSTFAEKMKVVRTEHHLASKEIAFKDFGMGQVRRALPDYLAAIDMLPGFLCSVSVDKRISTLFGPDDKQTSRQLVQLLDELELGGRAPAEVEKLFRVVHMIAYLVALFISDGQKLFWASDNDSICANPQQHRSMLALLDRVLPVYTSAGCNIPIVGGAVPFDARNVEINDLLSLPDIVAGSLNQYLSKSRTETKEDIVVKEGAEKVFCFLARDGIGLKKACFIIRKNEYGNIERGTIELSLVNPPKDAIFIPIVD